MSKKSLPKAVTAIELSGRNSHIDYRAERLGLGCVYDGARYHIWLDPKTLNVGEVLYKNALVGHGAEGYFNTRSLKPASAFSQALIAAMLKAYHSRKLLAKFEAAERREAAAEKTKSGKARREHRIRKAALSLYEACMETWEVLGGRGDHLEARLGPKLTAALQKADGQKRAVSA